jgi:hypothetical protein
MELHEFEKDEIFHTPDGPYLCTDIGSRVVVGISTGKHVVSTVDPVTGAHHFHATDVPELLQGSGPYLLEEDVFDEYAQEECKLVEWTTDEKDEYYGVQYNR